MFISGNGYDRLAEKGLSHPVVLAGECALQRNSLTTYVSDKIQCWTSLPSIHGVDSPFIAYYFSPLSGDIRYTEKASTCSKLLVPSPERALVEFIMFHDYFGEWILLEGLQTYMRRYNTDNKLYKVARDLNLQQSRVLEWLTEAERETSF